MPERFSLSLLEATVAFGVLATHCVGCDSSASTSPQAQPIFVAPAGCGNACPCDDGSLGKWDCSTYACTSCVTCPNVTPGTSVGFDACGGEPFGTWTVTSVDVSGMKYVGYVSDTPSTGSPADYGCAAQLVKQSDLTGLVFRISLVSGGTGTIVSKGPIATLDLSGDCARHAFYKCENQPNCVSVSDCICECAERIRPLSTRFTWTRTGSTLNLALGDFGAATYSYCVQGDTMKLVDSASGVAYGMKRLLENGVPLRCSSRTTDSCTPRSVALDDCYLGQCSGSGSCDAYTESSCTNRAGCSWNASACNGTAPSTCGFFDYGVVPGCVYLSAGETAMCVGTPSPCASIGVNTCGETPGCAVGTQCVGRIAGFPYGCSESDVGVLTGCSCDNYGSCSSYKCENQTAANCRDSNCILKQTTCQGNPLSCSQHSTSKCPTVPGCSLQKTSN